MAAFAKGAAAKAKKAESQPATPSADESSVHPLSDDEEDDSAVLPKPKAPEAAAAKSKAQQRKEALQRMMEQDDEEEEEQEKEDTPMEEPEEELEEEKPAPESEKEEPAEIVSASGDGRRRGKRQVMKPRRFLDEEGNMGKLVQTTLNCLALADTILHSHCPRAGLGVVLGRRKSSSICSESEAGKFGTSGQKQEGRAERARQYYVFLQQEGMKCW